MTWTPSSLTGIVDWGIADDAGSITQAGGPNQVSAWAGQLAAITFSQTTVASRPETGTRTINSLNALDFDGTTDQMDGGADLNLASSTVYLVLKADVITGANTFMFDGTDAQFGSGAGHRCAVGWLDGANTFLYQGATLTDSGIAMSTSALSIVSEFSNSASDKQYVNGVAGVAADGGSNHLGFPRLGANASGSNTFNGLIAAWAIVSGVSSAGDRAQWGAYVARWGITASDAAGAAASSGDNEAAARMATAIYYHGR